MSTSRQCSMCTKSSGSMHCTGCDKYFCWKDLKTHREGMFVEMDTIVEERNHLQDAINNTLQINDRQHPLIEQIEKWKNTTIEKIKQIAEQVHQQAIQLLNARQMKINSEFKSFSQELAHLKDSEDYFEHDLARLNQKINQFKQDLKQSTQPPTIELHTQGSDNVNWDILIYVEEKQTYRTPPRALLPSTPVRPLATPVRPFPSLATFVRPSPPPSTLVRPPLPMATPVRPLSPPATKLLCWSYSYMKINKCNRNGRACPKCSERSSYKSFVFTYYPYLAHTK